MEDEKSNKADKGTFYNHIYSVANSSSFTFFMAVLVGYALAILATVVIMIVFDHAQPALLYLVPDKCVFDCFGEG